MCSIRLEFALVSFCCDDDVGAARRQMVLLLPRARQGEEGHLSCHTPPPFMPRPAAANHAAPYHMCASPLVCAPRQAASSTRLHNLRTDGALLELLLALVRAAPGRKRHGLRRVVLVELLVPLPDRLALLLELALVELFRNVVGKVVRVFLLLLVERGAVVAAQRATQELGAVEVVDCQHGAALILVADERETLGLARLRVARQIDVDNLAKLREDDHDVALAQLVW
eukprot:443833-Prymnesium_polylepis.1